MPFDPQSLGAIPVSQFSPTSIGATPAGIFQPATKPVSTSPFNPNTPPDQAKAQLIAEAAKGGNKVTSPIGFSQPTPAGATQMDYSNAPGTNASSHIFSGTRDALGDVFVKPEQKLLAGAGTRIAQAGVQVKNEFQNPGYDTPVDYGNPQRKNSGGKVNPLPINAPAPSVDTHTSETNIQNPQQQLGVTVEPQKQGMEGAKQIGEQALNAADAIGNVALGESLVKPTIKGLTKTGEAIVNTAQKFDVRMGGEAAQKALGSADKQATETTWKMVQPELSKLDLAEAVKKGDVVKRGPLGTVEQVAQGRNAEMVEAAKPYVTNAKDPLEAVSSMQKGIADEATTLRQGLKETGATYTKSQLQGAFKKIAEDPNLISDATLAKKAELLRQKALEFAGNGGTLDQLQDVNTKLDAYIKKYYPNLYSSDALTPLRQAVRDTRNAVKEVIESRLKDSNVINSEQYLASLKKQSLLYDAIDNTAPKVGKVGTNVIDRFTKANPKTTKAIKYGAAAIGLGELGKHIIP